MRYGRRSILKSLALAPAAVALGPGSPPARVSGRDVYKELGIRSFINAAGTYTYLSASLMPRPVVEAIESASRQFVYLNELQAAVGKRISALLGCEAALVSAGAASAISLGTAACIAGTDPERIRRLPDTEGMRNEVLIPKGHRNEYDHAVRNAGARLIEVETLKEAERAIGERTAMLVYFNVHGPRGQITAQEFAALGQKSRIPSLVDAAADIPPVENYRKFLNMGYDLAAFSGGKILRGPQCSGMLLGRKDLIQAALANTNPQGDSLGRTNKVGKEEMVGLWAALEHFLSQDSKVLWKEWERRCSMISKPLEGHPGLKVATFVPEIANAVPHLRVTWDASKRGVTPEEAATRLRDGEPRIEVRDVLADGLEIAVFMLEPGEEGIVGRRLKEVLTR